jgi:carotenoid cleavage dioxygenase
VLAGRLLDMAHVLLRVDDVAAGPIARIAMPQRIPYGFHATWVPSVE